MQSISRHNERQNKQYGNKDIDTSRSDLNYHLKQPQENSYEREFYRLKEKNKLKGNLRLTGKKQSNVACEFLITSDKAFFDKIGQEETKRYFKTAYDFACKKCGEKNIISAVVHMDETTPHMHLTYIPVVQGKKKGQDIEKVNCSEFWKGFNSYGELQDNFHAYVKEHGFDLDRGETREEQREHLSVNEFKAETLKKQVDELEHETNTLQSDLKALKKHYENVKDIKVAYHQIDEIEGKKGVLNKSKVIVSEKDFEMLKDGAKKGATLEYELERVMSEINRLKNREDRTEKVAYKYKNENEQLKDKVNELSEKVAVFNKMFSKSNVKGKQLETIFEKNLKELRAEEKAKEQLRSSRQKQKFRGIEPGE